MLVPFALLSTLVPAAVFAAGGPMPPQLDKRGLPITATTTVTVEAVVTETVWWTPAQVTLALPMPAAANASTDSFSASSSSAVSSSISSAAPVPSSSSVSATPTSPMAFASPSSHSSAIASSSSSSEVTFSPSSTSVAELASSASTFVSASASSAPASSASSASALTSILITSASSSVVGSSSVAGSSPSSSAAVSSSSVVSSSSSSSSSTSNSVVASSSSAVPSSSAAASSSSWGVISSSSTPSALPSLSSTSSSASSSSSSSASSWSSSSSSSAVSSSSAMSSSVSKSASSLSAPISSSATPTSSVVSSSSSSKVASSTSSSASASATHVIGTSGPIMAAYYPDWTASVVTPSEIDFTKFDWVDFAFAIPDSSFSLYFTQDNSETSLKSVVSYAHAAGKKVKLSIGGWTGSTYFSNAMLTSTSRATFIKNIVATYTAFNLDGIDIDWEYPAGGGDSGNTYNSNDAANYLLFLTSLRSALPVAAKISAAVQVWPFTGSNGSPLTDVSAFAKVLDWITIMNYDVWGSSTTPGPNAPLSDGCGDSLQPSANAYAAVTAWTTAGFPASQILLGVASYGYISQSTATALVDKKRKRRSAVGHRATSVTVQNEDGGTTDGQIMFSELVSQGALVLDAATNKYIGGGGFTYEWDSCSSTPWLRSSASGQIVTYDDPDSLSLKAQFSLQSGLLGVNMWDMHGDIEGNWVLTKTLRAGLGLS